MLKDGHRNTLAKRFEGMAADLEIEVESINWHETLGISELLLDSSGGAATEWFATGLTRRGIPFREIDVDSPLNEAVALAIFLPLILGHGVKCKNMNIDYSEVWVICIKTIPQILEALLEPH